jgi:hypothetical protein
MKVIHRWLPTELIDPCTQPPPIAVVLEEPVSATVHEGAQTRLQSASTRARRSD